MTDVVLPRTLHITTPLQQGPDVAGLQQLLNVPADGIYGQQTAEAVYRAKLILGYQNPDRTAAQLLADYLTGKKMPTPAMVKRGAANSKLLNQAGSSTNTSSVDTATGAAHETKVRAAVVEIWHYLIANAHWVHYPVNDVRVREIIEITTMAELEAAVREGLTIDCSQTVTLVCHVAGAGCPNGSYAKNWAADGNTETLLEGCEHITKTQTKAGDIRIYGPGGGHHAAQVLAKGTDPLLGSQGKETPDPHAIRDSQEVAVQPPGGAWLRLPL